MYPINLQSHGRKSQADTESEGDFVLCFLIGLIKKSPICDFWSEAPKTASLQRLFSITYYGNVMFMFHLHAPGLRCVDSIGMDCI